MTSKQSSTQKRVSFRLHREPRSSHSCTASLHSPTYRFWSRHQFTAAYLFASLRSHHSSIRLCTSPRLQQFFFNARLRRCIHPLPNVHIIDPDFRFVVNDRAVGSLVVSIGVFVSTMSGHRNPARAVFFSRLFGSPFFLFSSYRPSPSSPLSRSLAANSSLSRSLCLSLALLGVCLSLCLICLPISFRQSMLLLVGTAVCTDMSVCLPIHLFIYLPHDFVGT